MHAALTQAATQLVTDVSAMMPGGPGAAREVTDSCTCPLESVVVMPLLIGQRMIGIVVLGRDDGRPRFTEADVAVIEELDRRLATGMAHIEAFAREHTVAETLQYALMPDTPPRSPASTWPCGTCPPPTACTSGVTGMTSSRSARDRVALAIGDVAGHSIDSASIMGQIRSLLRAYTLETQRPRTS